MILMTTWTGRGKKLIRLMILMILIRAEKLCLENPLTMWELPTTRLRIKKSDKNFLFSLTETSKT
jgi:hypothetical protein